MENFPKTQFLNYRTRLEAPGCFLPSNLVTPKIPLWHVCEAKMVLRFTKYDGILGPEHKRNAHLEQSQLLPWEHEANQIHLQIEYYIGWKVVTVRKELVSDSWPTGNRPPDIFCTLLWPWPSECWKLQPFCALFFSSITSFWRKRHNQHFEQDIFTGVNKVHRIFQSC